MSPSAGASSLRRTFRDLAELVNTTSLVVDRGQLRVRHGPVAWPGGIPIDSDHG